ncbi:MAG: YHS domain-containing protein [Deltaproteobacteria bacterium]|nr:YHS domain-containing protein [Deltaproteobacteria bacterium]
MVVDPFCGMTIKRGEAAVSAEWNGKTYYFCLPDHRDAFLADPQRALCRLAGADAGPECDAH